MAKIGVIVPVYNAESYLRKCIDSILSQTFQDFELLLVDDGSDDRSGKICDEYGEKNRKVKVIHKEHKGVSDARNRGVDENTGEYIAFIDSDDWVDKGYLETLYRMAEETNADLVISSWREVIEGRRARGKQQGKEQTAGKAEMISRAEAYRCMMIGERNMGVAPWAKLYHRKVFQSFRYPVGEIYEDLKVIDRIVESCERIVRTFYAGYFYFKRRGSIVHGKMSEQYVTCIVNAKYLWEFIGEHYPEIEDAARLHYIRTCFGTLNRMLVDSGYQEECREMRKEIIKEEKFLLSCSYVRVLEKMRVLSLLFGISCYQLMWKLYLWWTEKDSGTARL